MSEQAMLLDCETVARGLLEQPGFFDGIPAPASVQCYTGARSALNDERLVLVGALRLLGASDREIERSCAARGFPLTRRSIPVLLRSLEKSGRITPLKERLVQWTSDNAEASALLLGKLLDDAAESKPSLELAAMLKAVGQVNSFQLEKYQLLTGQATERIETVVAAGRSEIERWLAETRDVSPANDSESAAGPQEPKEICPVPQSHGQDDATSATTWPVEPAVPSIPAAAARHPGGGVPGGGPSDVHDASIGS